MSVVATEFAERARTALPMPGAGRTLERWTRLADVAEESLSLAKWFEAHHDALAILQELGEPIADGTYGVFAAEGAPLVARGDGDRVRLTGRKLWCSGAEIVDIGLVTCVDERGERRLAEVSFRQNAISFEPSTWAARGMSDARTVATVFESASARLVSGPRAYLDRPGFWHGAIGVAACWYGGARGIARHLREACTRRADAHSFVHLGVVDRELQTAAAALRSAAQAIDDAPTKDMHRLALVVRDLVEEVATEVIRRSDRALGPGPRATQRDYSTRVEDLSVFIRQNHAERDREALGRLCCDASRDDWNLDARDA